jgi:hypothetical protein
MMGKVRMERIVRHLNKKNGIEIILKSVIALQVTIPNCPDGGVARRAWSRAEP